MDPEESNSPKKVRSAATSATIAGNEVSAGDLLYSQGQFQAAMGRFRRAVELQPNQPDFHYRVASTAWKLDMAALVERHYLEAARLDPRFADVHKMLAQWFISRRDIARAMQHSGLALELASNDADVVITRAVVLTADKQIQAAERLLKPIIDSGYTGFHLASAFADLASETGRQDEAIALIERTLLGGKVAPVLARRLHVSAASLLEATGRTDEAFAQMRRAKELSPQTFDPERHTEWVSDSIEYFTPLNMRSLPRATHQNARSIFIVGMPRSGTSLIEQILASHPAVFGAGELGTLEQIASSLSTAAGAPYPQVMDRVSIRGANQLAGQYLAVIESLNPSATFVTDKMPQNFLWLGLAEVLLPHCRVIHCTRDPRDTCLSCFLTDFDHGNGFSNDLAHLVSYYRDYQRLIRHWKGVLSLPMLDVRYEEMVADPESQTRRMLTFLNLPWDDRCLAFHQNERTVTTASRDQVRRPMYATSVGRWKRYEKSIPELLELTE